MRTKRTLVLLTVLFAAAMWMGSASASANSVTPTCTTDAGGTAACIDGWYTSPVRLMWSISPLDYTSASPDCGLAPTYSGDTNQVIECDVTWSSPPNIEYPYRIRVEISNPTASATLARAPDSNGWYNHPVSLSFGGSSFSGIASCTSPLTYSGPSLADATVSGTCTDNAGKTASATSAPLNYDATPPTITGATASRPPDYDGWYTHPVSFTFKGTDAISGISSCETATYSGPASGSVVGGCWDRAGNYASLRVPVSYLQHVSTAPRGASIASMKPLLLQWKAKRFASYYNVQIFRDGRKVLSRWPASTRLLLSQSWRFNHHLFRLKAGRYRWYVWPGFGSRASDRYGRMIVSAGFTVG